MEMLLLLSLLSLLLSGADSAKVPPSRDPFYTPEGNWRATKPGTILTHRLVPNPLVNVTYSTAYQLLYRTTDALGKATAAVTTIIVPPKPKFSKLLSYQIVYDTPDADCSPSYAMQEGMPFIFDEGFTYGLAEGWIVNTPDYEGPMGAYTVGTISGQATLDSIRAALASTKITKIERDAQVAMWGYSGGALASEWAAELQHEYAPELNISGTALGGLTPNVSSVLLSINNQSNAGLIPAGFLGVAAAYPTFARFLNASFVSPAKRNAFWAAKKECLVQLEAADLNINYLSYFTKGIGILKDPRGASVIERSGIMGIHGTPQPSNRLYFYKSTLDEISPVADTDALFKKYCAKGVSIQYVRDAYGDHETESVSGGLGALEFLVGIFEGSYRQVGCTEVTRNKAGAVISGTSLPPMTATSSGVATKAGGSMSATMTA